MCFGVWLSEVLWVVGVEVDESFINFIFVCFVLFDEVDFCDEVLKVEGILVCKVGGYGLLNCLCIIIGDECVCCCVVYIVK